MRIDEALQEDPQLRPHLNQHPGLRIPGCWEGFELAVRAIVGQQISVKAAHTILTRLIERCGEKQSLDSALPLTHFFPTPEALLAADLSKIGLAYTRVESLKALAQAVADHSLILDGTADEAETRKKLLAIKGIGPWTMEYIAMRALRNPDGFPESDLELQKKIKCLQLDPKKWAPWRAYAAVLLFTIQFEDKP
jgi:3-methyladenine DNA glycosylase/8-oxoguanine DNA glycosylase